MSLQSYISAALAVSVRNITYYYHTEEAMEVEENAPKIDNAGEGF